uniref:Uncharacterized protein n=1 Tax=Rousettus aegyptiacus TaxID=9407 RepID=A0A7J8GAS7_ROUAE|nr:hypothetical protein HJG63_011649 [Rousettus aegyptiacus]
MFISSLDLSADLQTTVSNRLWRKFIGEYLRSRPHESVREARWDRGRDDLRRSVTRPQDPSGALEPGSPFGVVSKRGTWASPGTRLPSGRVCNLEPSRSLAPGRGWGGQLQWHFQPMRGGHPT